MANLYTYRDKDGNWFATRREFGVGSGKTEQEAVENAVIDFKRRMIESCDKRLEKYRESEK